MAIKGTVVSLELLELRDEDELYDPSVEGVSTAIKSNELARIARIRVYTPERRYVYMTFPMEELPKNTVVGDEVFIFLVKKQDDFKNEWEQFVQ